MSAFDELVSSSVLPAVAAVFGVSSTYESPSGVSTAVQLASFVEVEHVPVAGETEVYHARRAEAAVAADQIASPEHLATLTVNAELWTVDEAIGLATGGWLLKLVRGENETYTARPRPEWLRGR